METNATSRGLTNGTLERCVAAARDSTRLGVGGRQYVGLQWGIVDLAVSSPAIH